MQRQFIEMITRIINVISLGIIVIYILNAIVYRSTYVPICTIMKHALKICSGCSGWQQNCEKFLESIQDQGNEAIKTNFCFCCSLDFSVW